METYVKLKDLYYTKESYFKLSPLAPEGAMEDLMRPRMATALSGLMDWYEASRSKSIPEEGMQGPRLYNVGHSSYETDSFILHYRLQGVDSSARDLYQALAEEVAYSLEKWADLEEGTLTLSKVHGPRLYRNGSVLRWHSDWWGSHALAASICIGHRGVQQPWPFLIEDHEGKIQSVSDRPGDIILYEATISPHGRPVLLRGREVAQLFLHYKPKSGWPNPPPLKPKAQLVGPRKNRLAVFQEKPGRLKAQPPEEPIAKPGRKKKSKTVEAEL